MEVGARPEFLREEGFRLLLFGGKGGVGKTTCAAAAALSLARHNPARTVLLVSTDPAHSLADCFGGPSTAQNLVIREIDPQESLTRFKARAMAHLRTVALRGTFLDQTDVTQLLDLSMPGLDEVMALLEIGAWVKDARYASIVVDTAPAGHTLRLLGLPAVMRRWLDTLDAMLAKHRYMVQLYRGVYRKDATDLFLEETAADIEALGTLLRAPARCRFVLVMLAEPLSLSITQRMVMELKELDLPVREVVVNRLAPAQPDCPICTGRASRQARVVEEVTRALPGYALWGLPLFLEEVRGVDRLATVWEHAYPLEPASMVDSGSTDHLQPGAISAQPSVDRPAPLPAVSMKLLLFAGKGGVGKTTLACASALRLAEEWGDKEILLFSIDPAHSLSACLGQAVGPTVVRVARGVSAIEMNAQAEYAQLKRDYADEMEGVFTALTGETMIDLTFDREVMERVLDLAPPGLDEVLALTRIIALLDRGQYDVFILDTAPTGHLLRFLETPELIEEWLKTFFGLFLKYREVFRLPRVSKELVELSKRVKRFRRMLADPALAALVAVAIPTVMAYEETRDLVAACERMGVAIPILFVNLVTPPSSCPTCSALSREEASLLRRYEGGVANQHCAVVFQQGDLRDLERLRVLGRALYRGHAAGHRRVTEPPNNVVVA